MNINDKIKEERLRSGLTLQALGEIIGVDKAQIYNWENGKRNPKVEYLTKLSNALRFDFVKFLEESYAAIEKPHGLRTPKTLPQITPDENGKSIPFYDTEVFATISPAMSDIVAMKPQTFITIPIFNQGEFAVQVTGHSMKGYINHGDWIVVKRITEVGDLIYGEPYLIITKADNIKTVKFIRKGSSDEYFTLTPYNTVQFEPQELKKESVLEIYKVIGLFRNM